MNCANCESEALYEYKLVENKSILYCDKHLPRFLDGLRRAGNLTTTEAFTDNLDSALAALEISAEKPKKKSKAKVEEPPVEAPVVEEPVIEEPVVETPASEEINESNS